MGQQEMGGERGTNQVPVKSVQQVLAAATSSAGPAATQAADAANGMSVAAMPKKYAWSCIMNLFA
jgi:hypothetical protein